MSVLPGLPVNQQVLDNVHQDLDMQYITTFAATCQ